MITAALRTGLPLSSLITKKVRIAVGPSSSFCAAATAQKAKIKKRQTTAFRFIDEFLCPGESTGFMEDILLAEEIKARFNRG
jgi:hypothetical protein